MHILAQSRVFDRKLYALAIHNSDPLAIRGELYEFAGSDRIISRFFWSIEATPLERRGID